MITKEKLIEYFKGDNNSYRFDVTLTEIFKDLELTPDDIPKLEVYLEELINEKWITKAKTMDGTYEYDSGEKMDFGGIQ